MGTLLLQREECIILSDRNGESIRSCVDEESDFLESTTHHTPQPADPEEDFISNDFEETRDDCYESKNPLVHAFDHVFWFGDLNFRICGTREVVDGLIENHLHDALRCNDELTMLMRFNNTFAGLTEGPLNFFPTYKFDRNSGEREREL